MAITVRVYGSRRRVLPDGDTATVEHVPGESVRELLARLKVPDEEVWMVVVNNRRVELDHVLSDRDNVGIMSPIGGG